MYGGSLIFYTYELSSLPQDSEAGELKQKLLLTSIFEVNESFHILACTLHAKYLTYAKALMLDKLSGTELGTRLAPCTALGDTRRRGVSTRLSPTTVRTGVVEGVCILGVVVNLGVVDGFGVS